MPRGRLIFPFIVELGLLDTAATAADPDGAGPQTSGYDDEFREPVMLPPTAGGSARGTIHRVETTVRFKAQIEDDTADALQMAAAGNSPTSTMGLVFHFSDLEKVGAVSMLTGKPSIKAPGARLIAIYNPRSGQLIERFDEEPGLFATQAKSLGFGLGPDRNLLLVIFQERSVSAQATS